MSTSKIIGQWSLFIDFSDFCQPTVVILMRFITYLLGPEVKIKHNDWLLADTWTRVQKQQIIVLYFEFKSALQF